MSKYQPCSCSVPFSTRSRIHGNVRKFCNYLSIAAFSPDVNGGAQQIRPKCSHVNNEPSPVSIVVEDVVRLDHCESVEDIIRLCRDVEKTVFSRGLRYQLEDRVLVHGARAVLFK